MSHSKLNLTSLRLSGGVWESMLSGVTSDNIASEVVAYFGDTQLDTPEFEDQSNGQLLVRVPVPVGLLADGMQVLSLHIGETLLGSCAIVAGMPLEKEPLAELALLRAELDLLKRAFRHHCGDNS